MTNQWWKLTIKIVRIKGAYPYLFLRIIIFYLGKTSFKTIFKC